VSAFFWGQFMKIEDKLNLSEDRGQIPKIEESPLKNQADGQPTHTAPDTGLHKYWWSTIEVMELNSCMR